MRYQVHLEEFCCKRRSSNLGVNRMMAMHSLIDLYCLVLPPHSHPF